MRVLITAGPTREPIDAVRFISNRSSGRTGLAVARAAVDAGHAVTLLAGPGVELPGDSENIAVARFQTCADLRALLSEHFPESDLLIMAAAVADYRPAKATASKLERAAGGLTLHLEPTPDLVAEVAAHKRADQRVIAFALEPAERMHERARGKLERKGVDAIVANSLESMEGERIQALWLRTQGEPDGPATLSKAEFGRWLIERAQTL